MNRNTRYLTSISRWCTIQSLYDQIIFHLKQCIYIEVEISAKYSYLKTKNKNRVAYRY